MKRILVPAFLAAVVLYGIYVLLTIYDDTMPFGRMWETPAVKPHEQPLPAMADQVVPFSGGEALLRETPDHLLKSPFDPADATAISDGKLGYTHYCIQCHGPNYDGQGTVGQSFTPLPTDLRDSYVQSMSPQELFRFIGYSLPGSRHPPLSSTIAPTDRWRIVSFVKSMGPRGAQSQ